MNWENLVKEQWSLAKDLIGVDIDQDDYISKMRQTLNNETESTEFMFEDLVTNMEIKVKSMQHGELNDLMADVAQKLADAADKKKTHSEVFTKREGAESVIQQAYRRNPQPFLSMNSKLCEVSFGAGNFIVAMVDFLMVSLRSQAACFYGTGKQAKEMSDDELRIYILDNMIYGVELQSHFPGWALFTLDQDQKCKKLHKHLYQGDSLLFDFVFDGEDMMGKFDVVFGNPPYNVIEAKERSKYKYSSEKWKTTNEAGALHIYFIRLALDLLKKGGMMLYVTRASVLVTDNVSDFREQILKTYFDIQLVYIPQVGTLFEGAQTTGMGLMAIKKDATDPRTETTFIRFINNVEHECSYVIKDSDKKIPLLWDKHTIEIWEKLSALDNRYEGYKGVGRKKVVEGNFKLLDSIGTTGPVYGTTNHNKEAKRNRAGAGRTDIKVLVSTGCTDAIGDRLYWLEGIVKDSKGELEYTENVCGIVNKSSLDDIENTLKDPIITVYGSLFRVDRNTSAAFYRMMSYDYSTDIIDNESREWASTLTTSK